jgi:hypothetical protein
MKVTTLIPAYKPQYLFDLLQSLRNQSVKPARIIFSDDSPDQSFVAQLNVEPYKSAVADLNIQVFPGKRNGAYNNFIHLIDLWGGDTELFHILLDDDVIYPLFYERHLAAHAMGPISCSVSRRWRATEAGFPNASDLPVPPEVENHPSKLLTITSSGLFSTTVGRSSNWLGEFSNVVFASDMAVTIRSPELVGISYVGLEDLGAFLKASLHKPVAYINDFLGFFRISPQQHSANPMGRPMKLAHLAYVALAIAGRRSGQMSKEQSDMCIAVLCPLIISRYGVQADMADLCAALTRLELAGLGAEEEFLDSWRAYVG